MKLVQIKIQTLLLCLFLVVLQNNAYSESQTKEIENQSSNYLTLKNEFQTMFDTWRKENNIVGSSLLIDSSKFNGAFYSGKKQINSPQAIHSGTLFGVGSITKTFISTLILTYESENKLNINDKLVKYLPKYKKWSEISIKELLNMTSGISNFSSINEFKVKKNLRWTPEKLIHLSYKQNLDFQHGTSWRYSNTNYLILGKIIEKISKNSLAKELENSLFKKLELKHTFFSDTSYNKKILSECANGYFNGKDNTLLSPSNSGAAGSMLMTASDLALFLKHLFVLKDILPLKQLTEMLDTVPIEYSKVRPENTEYGLGILVTDDKKFGKYIWYTGVIESGYSSAFVYMPISNTILIAQENTWTNKNFNILFTNNKLLTSVMNKLNENGFL